jgi:hypothetical protein
MPLVMCFCGWVGWRHASRCRKLPAIDSKAAIREKREKEIQMKVIDVASQGRSALLYSLALRHSR